MLLFVRLQSRRVIAEHVSFWEVEKKRTHFSLMVFRIRVSAPNFTRSWIRATRWQRKTSIVRHFSGILSVLQTLFCDCWFSSSYSPSLNDLQVLVFTISEDSSSHARSVSLFDSELSLYVFVAITAKDLPMVVIIRKIFDPVWKNPLS